MIAALIGLLDPISRIASKIADYKIAAQTAATDREKIAAEERVKALEARRDVMVAEGSLSRINAWTRTAFAIGPIYILNKIFIWDKSGLGTTDPLGDKLWDVVMVVVGFYFLDNIVARWKR